MGTTASSAHTESETEEDGPPPGLPLKRSVKLSLDPGPSSPEPSSVRVDFKRTEHAIKVKTVSDRDHRALADIAGSVGSWHLDPLAIADPAAAGFGSAQRPGMRVSFAMYTIDEGSRLEDTPMGESLGSRMSEVRGFPAARAIRSQRQSKFRRSKDISTVSEDSDESGSMEEMLRQIDSSGSEDEDTGEDDSKRDLRPKAAWKGGVIGRDSRMKTVAFLRDMTQVTEVKAKKAARKSRKKHGPSKSGLIRATLDSNFRNELMSERMAQVHLTIVGVIFAKDAKGALPGMDQLSPRSLKLSMATMTEDPRISGTTVSPFFGEAMDQQVVDEPVWSGVYCSGQLIGNQNAPWMHGMVKQLRTPLKKQEIYQSEKLYTHEYDSFDKELIFIDETMIFPVQPFKYDPTDSDESTALSDALSKLHPQVVAECFQNILADNPGGCLLIKLKQTDRVSSDAMMFLESSTRSLFSSKKGKADPTSVSDTVTGLAFAQLTIRDLLANVENVNYKDEKYITDDYLFQVPIHSWIESSKLKSLRSDMDSQGIGTVSGLLEKSHSTEPVYKKFTEYEIAKPKASGVLICQCSFEWDASLDDFD